MMGARTAHEVLDSLYDMLGQSLRGDVTQALEDAIVALSDVDWGEADFIELVLDDGPFSLFAVGKKVRIQGAEAFQEPTSELRPLLAHPTMERIVSATEDALAQADSDCQSAIASDVWFGVAIRVASWISASTRILDGRPQLPLVLSIKDQPPGAAVCDLDMMAMWSPRYDVIAKYLSQRS